MAGYKTHDCPTPGCGHNYLASTACAVYWGKSRQDRHPCSAPDLRSGSTQDFLLYDAISTSSQ
eukprot:751830-Amphidinium_carterae.2